MNYKEFDSIWENYNYEEIINNTDLDCEMVLNGLMVGITDIVGVYKPDGSIIFYNHAGYEFYNVTQRDVIGKRCFNMLGRESRCEYCTTEMAIHAKKIVRIEKYIPELDKYMDCCCNPVFNNAGEIVLIIEQLRDVTEKRKLEEVLKENEERYRNIVELSPDGIVIVVDGTIVLANNEAAKLYGLTSGELIGKAVKELVAPEFVSILKARMRPVLNREISKSIYDYKILRFNNEQLEVQISSSFLIYQGKPAIQSVVRDITKYKRSLYNAANIQKKSLLKAFPIPEKASMEYIYFPARTVSGDFYCLHKIDNDTVVGMIYDVAGKGITASLNVAAINVLFSELILTIQTPVDIVRNLNVKTCKYLDENFVAVCCFSFDFKNKVASIVGAGISRFIMETRSNGGFEENIVKGPFIGMFEDSVFDEKVINFTSGDKFYFFTDGLDDFFDKSDIIPEIHKTNSISDFKTYMENYFVNRLPYDKTFKDDCTLLAIQIK